jgi:hypothetical protein
LPSFRTGAEIAANAPLLLLGFNVAVQPDCGTTNALNIIFVPFKLATTMRDGLIAKAAGQPPVSFTCADLGPTTVDFVLRPEEQAIVALALGQMRTLIQSEAQARGFAFFSLDALFAQPAVRPPLNVATLLTSDAPFGSLMSLDGIHPNALGQALIATAAAQALNQRYDLGIPVP